MFWLIMVIKIENKKTGKVRVSAQRATEKGIIFCTVRWWICTLVFLSPSFLRRDPFRFSMEMRNDDCSICFNVHKACEYCTEGRLERISRHESLRCIECTV